jgi:hypothetical protein
MSMTTAWLLLCGFVLVPILIGQLLHHRHRRCGCRRPVRIEITVTKKQP